MKKKNPHRRFPVLMISSMLLLSPVIWLKTGLEQLNSGRLAEQEAQERLLWEKGTMPGQGGQSALHASSQQASQSESAQDSQLQPEPEQGSQPQPEQTSPAKPGREQEKQPSESGGSSGGLPAPETEEESMRAFFSGVLFIGDSRSVGIMEYAGLEGPDFFASSGMNVFRLWEKKISMPGLGELTLEELLKQKTYDTIFLMTGINELGYEHAAIVKQYAAAVQAIEELQPEAALYLCANLHVTKSRSDRDAIYNNANIDWLNAEIAGLAEGGHRAYIDVNPLFDDEEGALRSDYSGDDTHPYGKYYQVWGRWLYETCTGSQSETD